MPIDVLSDHNYTRYTMMMLLKVEEEVVVAMTMVVNAMITND
jgi:hypothetical protein